MSVTNTCSVIGEVAPHPIAEQANVKLGDELIQIDQTRAKNWQQILMAIIKRIGNRTKMEFKVRRAVQDAYELNKNVRIESLDIGFKSPTS